MTTSFPRIHSIKTNSITHIHTHTYTNNQTLILIQILPSSIKEASKDELLFSTHANMIKITSSLLQFN